MTRFQMELSGKLGQFWQTEAQKELERVKSDLDSCKITIDADGVARNSIGRALADDTATSATSSVRSVLGRRRTLQRSCSKPSSKRNRPSKALLGDNP